MSSLNIVCQLISDAIWNNEKISEDTKMTVSDRIDVMCTSLETARVFITRRRLVVVIPEDLANAIQAEASSCVDDPRAGLALGAEGVHWTEITPEPTDFRYPFESRYPSGGDLNSKALEKLRRDERTKLDSDALRPLTTDLVTIHTASREDTAKLFAQDKTYRALGGIRPFFDALSPDGKKCWATALLSEEDTSIRSFDSYDPRELLFRMAAFYTVPTLDNPHPLDHAFSDIAMKTPTLDTEALRLYVGKFGETSSLHADLFDALSLSDQLKFFVEGLSPPKLRNAMKPFLKGAKTIPHLTASTSRELSMLLRTDNNEKQANGTKSKKESTPSAKETEPPPIAPAAARTEWTSEQRTAHYRKKQAAEVQDMIDRAVAEALADKNRPKKSSAVASPDSCLNCDKPNHPPWRCGEPCENPCFANDKKRHVGRDCPYYKLMHEKQGGGPKSASAARIRRQSAEEDLITKRYEMDIERSRAELHTLSSS